MVRKTYSRYHQLCYFPNACKNNTLNLITVSRAALPARRLEAGVSVTVHTTHRFSVYLLMAIHDVLIISNSF